jgi:hypothetical protein
MRNEGNDSAFTIFSIADRDFFNEFSQKSTKF